MYVVFYQAYFCYWTKCQKVGGLLKKTLEVKENWHTWITHQELKGTSRLVYWQNYDHFFLTLHKTWIWLREWWRETRSMWRCALTSIRLRTDQNLPEATMWRSRNRLVYMRICGWRSARSSSWRIMARAVGSRNWRQTRCIYAQLTTWNWSRKSSQLQRPERLRWSL